ncbi:MAG: DUF3465 domain-containing protein [Rhodothermales bacterium]|jgi:hypothetical protein|nr:DUF3465 domain-containing protein [Rhodothermales bacterium]MDG2016722.1 DUF3465 domain-containing protein [Rhodothermales bacterium]HAY36555.1 hypothetical protein [Bacteroidota bacterium]
MDEYRGVVIRLLRDDNEGDRHQRFVIRQANGETILVAHNIDIAPRLNDLYFGAPLVIYGKYEWNDLGGIVHWTHRDPNGSHRNGWIDFKGKRYQ